jgi:hypothetical protein
LVPDQAQFFRAWTVDSSGNVSSGEGSVSGTAQAALELHLPLDETSGTTAQDLANGSQSWPIDGSPTWGAGTVGGALTLTGGERVVVGQSFFPGTGYGSYSLWVRPSGGGTPNANQFLMTQSVGGSNNSWSLRHRNGSGTISIYYQSRDGVTSSYFEIMGPAIPFHSWTHVAVVFEPTATTLFVDGQKVAAGPAGSAWQSANAQFLVGGSAYAGHAFGFFHGSLDDVRIYDLPLTAQEIVDLYLGN